MALQQFFLFNRPINSRPVRAFFMEYNINNTHAAIKRKEAIVTKTVGEYYEYFNTNCQTYNKIALYTVLLFISTFTSPNHLSFSVVARFPRLIINSCG